MRHEPLLRALSSPQPRVKYPAAKKLRALSERAPGQLYPHFDLFAGLLRSENSILRWNAILIIGHLAPADTEGKIDRMLSEYLAPICGPSLIDAGNTIRGAAAIAAAKPGLADEIAASILRVEHATYATPECRNVALGHAINAFVRLLPLVSDTRPIHECVARQKDNARPATRKKAERLLRRWPEATALRLAAAGRVPN